MNIREQVRLGRCGLKSYTPKSTLQKQLREAHAAAELDSRTNIAALRTLRNMFEALWNRGLIRAHAYRELRG